MGENDASVPVRGEGKILIMDDEESILRTTSRLLSKLGYEVSTSRNGTEMLDSYMEARSSGQPFLAVIMDLTIPGQMGGIESIKRLRDIDPAVKALVTSGYSNDPVMADYRSHGFSAMVLKPYRIEELSRILRDTIFSED